MYDESGNIVRCETHRKGFVVAADHYVTIGESKSFYVCDACDWELLSLRQTITLDLV